jgi:hypothetical protein
MSPLLRSLTYTQAALGPVVRSMLLQCYCVLDAFRRGYGSRELFGTLGRHLLLAEELARLGYEAHALSNFELAHTALMHLNEAEWIASTTMAARATTMMSGALTHQNCNFR